MPNYVSLDEGADALRAAGRIMVVGCSGGGKTTLSRKIAERFALRYLSMDRDVYWLAGWQIRDPADQRALIFELCAADRWIMDGNNTASFDLRVPRADLVLWVRLPRWRCFWGIARRVAGSYGRVRVGMAEGCPERLPDRVFLSYIWNFESRTAQRIIAGIDRHGPEVPVVVLRSHRAMERLLQ